MLPLSSCSSTFYRTGSLIDSEDDFCAFDIEMRARLPRGSASSWSPSESTLKEIAGFVSAIGGCGENRFFPPELVRWIRDVKAETDSVYLVLNSDEDAYEYKIAPLDQAMRRDHFFTLRYANQFDEFDESFEN